MEIRKKLIITLGLILTAFTLLLVFTLNRWYTTIQLQDLQGESYRLMSRYNRMMHRAEAMSTSKSDLKVLISLWEKAVEDLDQGLEAYTSMPAQENLSERMKKKVNEAARIWEQIQKDIRKTQDSLSSLQEQKAEVSSEITAKGVSPLNQGLLHGYYYLEDNNRKYSDSMSMMNTVHRNLTAVNLSSTRFQGILAEITEGVNAKVETDIKKGFAYIILLDLIVVLMSMVIAIVFVRRFSRNIRGLIHNMQDLSELDLTKKKVQEGHDEIAKLMALQQHSVCQIRDFITAVDKTVSKANTLKDTLSSGTEESVAALNETSLNIEEISKQIELLNTNIEKSTAAVSEMDGKINEISGRIDTQAKSVEGITGQVEEMTASVQSVEKLTSERRENAQELIDYVGEGGEKVDRTNEVIKEISKDVHQMLSIIEIINNVSKQTNLLSMNAAIESAHAGEAGRGFSVVAEEIRKLAESTSENVHVIGETLHRVTDNIELASKASDESAGAFQTIIDEVNEFVQTLDDIKTNIGDLSAGSVKILDSTSRVSGLSSSLNGDARYIKEQADSVEGAMRNLEDVSSEIVNGYREINIGTKEVLNNFHDIAQVTSENSEQIEEVFGMLKRFKVS